MKMNSIFFALIAYFCHKIRSIMKKFIWIVSMAITPLLFSGCGGGEEQVKETKKDAASAGESCVYTYDAASSKLTWTAFKTTEKLAVKGSFDSVYVYLSDNVSSPKNALESASFKINTASVFTDNTIRDATLRKYFFGLLKNNGEITGQIKKVEGDDKAGDGTIEISMNGVKRIYGYTYTIEGNVVVLKTAITFNSIEAYQAVDSLNVQCYELHKGPDGVSKLWPDVEIEIKAVLNKKC
jgi:polyisoprenoid-binding protein YceI